MAAEKGIVPDQDLIAALEAAISEGRPVAVMGPAGSGKSTLVRYYAENSGKSVLKAASSHVARLVLGKKDSYTAQQISTWSVRNKKKLRTTLKKHQLLVVDEFPLLSTADATAVLTAALSFGLGVIFCGDFMQLNSPTGDGVTPAWLDAKGFSRLDLTDIKRASDPETLELFQAIRTASATGSAAVFDAAIELGVERVGLGEFGLPCLGERAHVVLAHNADVDRLNKNYALLSARRHLAGMLADLAEVGGDEDLAGAIRAVDLTPIRNTNPLEFIIAAVNAGEPAVDQHAVNEEQVNVEQVYMLSALCRLSAAGGGTPESTKKLESALKFAEAGEEPPASWFGRRRRGADDPGPTLDSYIAESRERLGKEAIAAMSTAPPDAESVIRALAATVYSPELVWGVGVRTSGSDAPGTLLVPAVRGMLVVGVKQPFDSTKPYKKPGLNNQETGVLVSIKSDTDGSARIAVRSHITGRVCTIDSTMAHPGFALTFHRCQGQTFDCRLGVSSSKNFDPSMAYVAMSRVRKKDQLRIVTLPPSWL